MKMDIGDLVDEVDSDLPSWGIWLQSAPVLRRGCRSFPTVPEQAIRNRRRCGPWEE